MPSLPPWAVITLFVAMTMLVAYISMMSVVVGT